MKWLAYRYLRLRGWTFHGRIPDDPKLIAVGAPHTSNWDFIVFLAALHHWKMTVNYIGKHSLFRPPFGWFFRYTGGIPVDRSKPGGLVKQVAEAMDAARRMILVLAPEGTRSKAPRWKSGFLKIAEATGAPILLAAVDASRKELTIGPKLTYDGDAATFMESTRAFYADKEGFHPELKGPVTVGDWS
jgi:1-acyl-sn-glycerol-3-phosphate acyltransferase